MPYVITTKRPCYRDDDCAMYACSCRNTGWRVSRRAVATLDETMDYLCELVLFAGDADAPLPVDESGGTVGPLPDGTVIEVTRA
jgi:hypothetical protein